MLSVDLKSHPLMNVISLHQQLDLQNRLMELQCHLQLKLLTDSNNNTIVLDSLIW